jgi:hypothetical protein
VVVAVVDLMVQVALTVLVAVLAAEAGLVLHHLEVLELAVKEIMAVLV